MNKYSNKDQPEFLILQGCIFLAITIPIRYLVKKYKSIAPFNLFLILGAVIGSLIAYASGYNYDLTSDIPPYAILTLFIPFFTVSAIYSMDFYVFIRSLPQTITISCLGASLNVIILGMFFKHILHNEWSYSISFIAALIFVPIQPSYIIVIFKELAQYNYLSTFLEAETILSTVPILMAFKIGIRLLENNTTTFLTIFLLLLRYILGGLAAGIIVGKITAMLMCWLYSEPYSALCVSVGMILATYYLAEYILDFSGLLSLVCIISFISIDKHRFSSEVDNCFRVFWRIMSYFIQAITIMFATVLIIRHAILHFNLVQLYGTVITYFTTNVSRIASFFLMGIILNKMAYEMNVRCLMVLAWSGVKGCINLILALILVDRRKMDKDISCLLMDILVFLFLSLMINSSSMRIILHFMGISDISYMRKTNMDNCIKFIMDKRSSAINILKQDRFLTQANWSVARAQTMMKYPHGKIREIDNDLNTEEDEEFLWKVSRTLCTACQSELPFDMSEKELVNLMREGQMKILKAKKVSIIKQYETGNIDKNCMQVLVHIYDLMMASNQKTNIVDLKPYFRRNIWLERLMVNLKKLTENVIPEPPNTQFRKLCYYTMLHITYDYIMFGIVVIQCACLMYFFTTTDESWFSLITLIHIFFVLDCFVKITGYSRDKSLFNIAYYLRYKWNIFDFVFVFIGIFDIIVTYHSELNRYPFLVFTMKAVCFLRILKFFQVIQPVYGRLLKTLEYRVDSKNCFGYDLATALDKCTDEILGVLHQIIGSKFIIDIYRKHLLDEKQMLIRQLEHVQKERPWIAITVKTKQAIRTTLNSMQSALNELKVAGFVDNVEYGFIWKEIVKRQKVLRNMKFIQPSSRIVIFYEVPWLADSKIAADYLYLHAQFVTWEAGELICREGASLYGIYIVVNGMLRMYYNPKPHMLLKLREFGSIPVVDHLSTLRLENKAEISICPGDTLGELSVLTNKPYDCSVFAESNGEAFVLLPDVVKGAMLQDPDPISGLEARMWKHSIIDIAVAILLEIPLYQSYTPEQIKFKLEAAFVPNLRCYKMFVITEMMDEVLLMEGVVADFQSNEVFVAPMLIPRTVQKIVLPTSNLIEGVTINTKLLILPTADSKAYEIMEYEQEIAELVSIPSETCLIHRNVPLRSIYSMESKSKKSSYRFRS